MARRMWTADEPLFRAVITIKWKDGDQSVRYLGPFTSQGAASAAITRTKRAFDGGYEWWIGRDTKDIESIEGEPQRCTPDWRPVKNAGQRNS